MSRVTCGERGVEMEREWEMMERVEGMMAKYRAEVVGDDEVS
jgi:hypothetical protein